MADRQRNTDAVRWVRAMCEIASGTRSSRNRRPLRLVVLCGGVGIGKTVAAAYALARFWGRYVPAEQFRARFASTHGRDQQWVEQMLAAKLVVLDDLGTERSDGGAAAFHELVNRRHGNARLLTIVTTNLTWTQLRHTGPGAIVK